MAITSTAVPVGTIATSYANEFKYVDLREGLAGLPQKIAIFATFDPAKTSVVANEPVQVFTAEEAGSKFGFGFPAHIAAKHVLMKSRIVPVFIFPIAEASGAVASAGTITASGTATSSGTLSIYVGGQRVAVNILSGASASSVATSIADAITADTVNLPTTGVVDGSVPEEVDITAKYKGAIGNDITLAVNLTEDEKDKSPDGISLAVVAMSGGSGVPAVTDALNNFGSTWYTYIVNTFGDDTDVMDEFDTFNESERWDPLENTFFKAFYGSVDDFATVTAITDARKLDRTNGVIPSPNSYSLPLEIAAEAVGYMASTNQDDPAVPFTGGILDGITPGPESSQWTLAQADSAEKLGSSWTVIRDGKVTIKDILMHYHKTGEEPPAFRYAVDISKIATWAYNTKLNFESSRWEAKILVDDTDYVQNPNARKPMNAVADIYKIADAAAAAGIITRPDFTKENTVASIDVANPNRINIRTTIILSGATRIISLTTNFGFNFGSLAA